MPARSPADGRTGRANEHISRGRLPSGDEDHRQGREQVDDSGRDVLRRSDRRKKPRGRGPGTRDHETHFRMGGADVGLQSGAVLCLGVARAQAASRTATRFRRSTGLVAVAARSTAWFLMSGAPPWRVSAYRLRCRAGGRGRDRSERPVRVPDAPAGAYVLRARLTGFVALREQTVDVHPSGRTASTIALRRATASDASEFPVLCGRCRRRRAGSPAGSDSRSASRRDDRVWQRRPRGDGVADSPRAARRAPGRDPCGRDLGMTGPSADRSPFGVGWTAGRARAWRARRRASSRGCRCQAN